MLLALRRPHELIAAQFWAEDGAIFFSQRLALGPWHSIFVPYNGYQHLIPRLIAAAAAPLRNRVGSATNFSRHFAEQKK